MFAMVQDINDNFYLLKNASDQKFYIYNKELRAIRNIQQHMQDLQNTLISTQSDIFLRIFLTCVIKINFCTTVNWSISNLTLSLIFESFPIFSNIFSNIKAYRASFKLRTNVFA